MSETDTPNRRAEDPRIGKLVTDVAEAKAAQGRMQGSIDENTEITQRLVRDVDYVKGELKTVSGKADELLGMKTMVENHIAVLCTWARWARRTLWAILSAAGVALPVLVALKQLGWW